jgi:5,10-methylenetetrahydromethanopterin reductase
VSDRALRAFSVSGTPFEAIAQIEALIDAGATHVCFGPPLGAQFDAALELIGTRVLPHFRGRD